MTLSQPQVFNRDFSVLVLNVFSKLKAFEEEEKRKQREEKEAKKRADAEAKGETPKEAFPVAPYAGLEILEALAASGLRSIRYWKEVDNVKSITVNDLDATAVQHMKVLFS